MRYFLLTSVFFLTIASCTVTESKEPAEVPDQTKIQNEDDTKLRITKMLSLSGPYLSEMQLRAEELDEDLIRADFTEKVKLYYDFSQIKMDLEK